MGNKAGNLLQLKKAGFRVPKLIVCNNAVASEEELMGIVKKAFSNKALFAVRSSANNEDSKQKSMAGYYYSAIGVTYGDLFKEYNNVLQSYKGVGGNVIIQQFVPSTKAGVIFSDRGDGKLVINASLGLCKPVVEGGTCDEYLVLPKGKIESANIAQEKRCMFFKNNSIENQTITEIETLSLSEIKKLTRIALKIQKLFNAPQDIEWCMLGSKIYILQSRPITRALVEKSDKIFYDSANIAESYSGIVKPLTISFAASIYKVVYQNLLIASGLSRKKIKRHKAIFDNMVANFYGRLYYNMNNWYLMMSFMPGYKRNKENLEDMITSNIREDVVRSVLPSLSLKISYPFIVIYKLVVFNKTINRFKQKVKQALIYYRNSPIQTWSFTKCRQEYEHLANSLLEKWHIPVENDFLMMTYLGILKKRFTDDELKEHIRFGNISSRQVNMLKDLSKDFHAYASLREAIINKDVEKFDAELSKNTLLKEELNNYFEVYGGRFANELKLESNDISEDKLKLLSILQLYSKQELRQGDNKETIVENGINGMSQWLLRRFKKYASQREELRLLRSNCFSIVRRLFNQMGKELQQKNILTKAEDIYYLELKEIFDSDIDKKFQQIQELVEIRKKKYERYSVVQPQSWFQVGEDENVPLVGSGQENVKTINARACTHGKAEGKARVFQEFYLPEDTNFDILVAKHTDPGWTPLIGLAKGLIIEHGGILSHAAIVSRELGIPAVIGATDATRVIADDVHVQIDGATGKINILSDEK